jgi:hypothetical protein
MNNTKAYRLLLGKHSHFPLLKVALRRPYWNWGAPPNNPSGMSALTHCLNISKMWQWGMGHTSRKYVPKFGGACGRPVSDTSTVNLYSIGDAERLAHFLMLVSSPLPQNLAFQTIDLSKPFPFKPGTFDIIHVRFVYFHVRL